MILQIINVMIVHVIYHNCKFNLFKIKSFFIFVFISDYQQKNVNDDDQESGTGNSIPHSPIREHETFSYLLGDVQLSLCGNLNKQSIITDDLFNTHLIPYETFANNPSIVNDPNLVVRISGKFYNWSVGSALIASTSIYHKSLPSETIEQLQEKHMTQTKSRTTSSGSWWPFYGKKVKK